MQCQPQRTRLYRSAKPGALTAATFRPPRRRFQRRERFTFDVFRDVDERLAALHQR